jgi:hypothetical protein
VNQSQEREDEHTEDEFEYTLEQVVGRPLQTPPVSIFDRLMMLLIVGLLGLVLWIVLRGVCLSIRELVRLVW